MNREKRDKCVTIRFSQSELDLLERLCWRQRIYVATHCRQVLLNVSVRGDAPGTWHRDFAPPGL